MATKKKAKKPLSTAEKRSIAAKKGWATRRRNAKVAAAKKKAANTGRKIKNAQLGVPKKKRKANPRISVAGKSLKALQEQNRILEERLRIIERTKDWVDAMPPEYLSREGHVTLKPSMARHDPDYFDMVARLELARDEGEWEFDQEVYMLASEYDYDVREIYTMFFSP